MKKNGTAKQGAAATGEKPKVEILVEGLTPVEGNVTPLTAQGQAVGEKIAKVKKSKAEKVVKASREMTPFGHVFNSGSGDVDMALLNAQKTGGAVDVQVLANEIFVKRPVFNRLGQNVRDLKTVLAKVKSHLAYLPGARGIYTLTENGQARLVGETEYTAAHAPKPKIERIKHEALPAEVPASLASACEAVEAEQAQKSA